MTIVSDEQLKNQHEWQSIILCVKNKLLFANAAALLKWKKTDPFMQCSHRLLRSVDDDEHSLWETYRIIRKNIIYGGLKYLIIKDLGNGKSFYKCYITRPVKSEKKITRIDGELINLAESIATIAKISG